MDIGEPPPGPFAGMTPKERKRAQEAAIISMVYDLSEFHSVTARERPDFALARRADDKPFGVEVTQLFIDESQARFNLIPGYPNRLWSGGSHLHKTDIRALQSVKVRITDKTGRLRHSNLPAVITTAPSLAAFRSALCRAIEKKAAKGYLAEEFTHLNLVILDWFRLEFDGGEYLTDQFFDDEVRKALKDCPFREIFLVIYSTGRPKKTASCDPAGSEARVVPLQQLLAMERIYVTGHAVDNECGGDLSDAAELNRLVIDHVSRVQGYGEAVQFEGRPFLRYKDQCRLVRLPVAALADVKNAFPSAA